jgi:type IV pilus assembly protein PilF
MILWKSTSKRVLALPSLVVLLCILQACVTESSGGLPDPAATPIRVQAQLDLARGYLEQGNIDRARTSLHSALEIDPRAVEAHTLLGVLYASESENALAEQYFKTALKIDPTNSQALNNYGSFLYSQGRYEEAVTSLQLLVQDTDYRARGQAFENLGLAQIKVDDMAGAKESFNRALQFNFVQPRASLELAQIAYDEGEYAIAGEYFDGYRSYARQTARTLCLGIKLARTTGDADQMASYALALNNLFPDSNEAERCVAPN